MIQGLVLNEQNANSSYKSIKDNSGKITIEYKNLDQFELLSNLLTK